METEGVQWYLSKVRKILGKGTFFRPILPRKEMQRLLKTLRDNPCVDLHLYTSLPLPLADQLITHLGLGGIFHPHNRLSCLDLTCRGLKHPTEVDFNTKRVIIVTGSRKDHLEEDSQYFLVVKSGLLEESVKRLDRLARNNLEIDELHNELSEVKVWLEPEYESGAE